METKIYDCSNSDERPAHRGKGCPKENDIVRYLKENCKSYNCKFVDDISKADVLFTNDVFPKHLQDTNIYKVKRMDGVFWHYDLIDRNKNLNKSAEIADSVIFISDYSEKSYVELYGESLKYKTVVVNQADSNVFYKQNNLEDLIFITTASSWEREEKRFCDLIAFAKMIPEKIYVIGNTPFDVILPQNIIPLGYISNPVDISNALNKATAFLNLSYKDACPKTVVQALCCELPVLYADSGGVSEMVEDFGIKIKDIDIIRFENETKRLYLKGIIESYTVFKDNFKNLRLKVAKRNNDKYFKDMLDSYFEVLKRRV